MASKEAIVTSQGGSEQIECNMVIQLYSPFPTFKTLKSSEDNIFSDS